MMASEDIVWFDSAVDRWLAVLLLALAAFNVGMAVAVAVVNPGDAWAALPSPLIILGLYFGLLFPMRYGVTSDRLIIRHGLVRQKVMLRNITSVEPTRSLRSSPALSFSRLRIRHGAGFWQAAMISPRDRAGFLDAIAVRTDLVRHGASLEPPKFGLEC